MSVDPSDGSHLHDPVAEWAVASCLVAYPEGASREVQDLNPSRFFNEEPRNVIDAFVTLYTSGEPVDALQVVQWLVKSGRIKSGQAGALLAKLTDPIHRAGLPTVGGFYRTVVQFAFRREALTAGQTVCAEILADNRPTALLAAAATLSAALAQSPDNPAASLRAALSRSVLSASALMQRVIPVRKKLLGDWFCEGDLGFVFAPRGVGKTWFGLDLACTISGGGTMGDWSAPEDPVVLYGDGEMAAEQIRERVQGMGGAGDRLLILNHQILFDESERSLNITDRATQEALTDYAVRQGVKLLVLDNLSSLASGMSENDGDEWEMVLAWLLDLRRRGIAVVIVHHAGRNGLMRGHSRREDAAFWILSLTDAKSSHADPRGARFVSRFTKPSRNTQQHIPAIEWHYQTEESTGEVRRSHRVADNLELLRQMVAEGITSCSDLAEEMGISKGQVSKLAAKGVRAGWLRKQGKDYAIVEGVGEVETK